MSIMLTIFDVCKKGKEGLCFKLPLHQMSKCKKKYIDLCKHVSKYKQVVFETLSWTFNGIWRVTYVTWAVK